MLISKLIFPGLLLQVFNNAPVIPTNGNRYSIHLHFLGGIIFALTLGNDKRAVNALEKPGWQKCLYLMRAHF